ncbi:MAG TPA: tripartite tricarboxylate transporter substrate binding protein [Burkholderiales bacterium]|nr:tripartite tricarboxylate transporter substrate binding protein [Burkholderiales bacterium]
MWRFLSPLRRLTLGALVVGLMLFATAQAQTFPSKPLRLVVPFGPGGSSDVVARVMADGATEALGQPMLIENVPGAGGNIGTARVVKAAPDGYTLVECTIGTCAINPSIYAQTGYDLRKDFAPVFLVGGVMNIFTVHPSMSVKSIAELVAYIKANPGKLPVAIGAVGSSNHLTPVWFASIAGLDMLYVPFKGAGDAITALLGGQVMMFVDNEPSILPQIKAGKARPLAVTGPRRSTYLPEVATMEELGYKGFVVEPWYGFMVPQGTPRAAVERLNSAFNAAIRNPRIKARLEEAGLRLIGGAPERLGEQIKSESERWAKVVKANNVKVE